MNENTSKKNRITVALLIIVLLAGLSLLLYPFVADYWNSMHQSQAIASYIESVTELDNESYDKMIEDAREYNATLQEDPSRFMPDEEDHQIYEQLLDMADTGIMGYVEIPSIDVSLPIYHGTSEEVLQIAVGHIEGSSLPVGGIGTHCAMSGHRGLPSSKLFTDLDQLSEGDIFTLTVLDETLTYEVDQIRVVEPDDISLLEIEPYKDLCTLVTCTPYGVNSHRLLVRGHRVENQDSILTRITADAMMIDSRFVLPIILLFILLIVLLVVLLKKRKRRRAKERKRIHNTYNKEEKSERRDE